MNAFARPCTRTLRPTQARFPGGERGLEGAARSIETGFGSLRRSSTPTVSTSSAFFTCGGREFDHGFPPDQPASTVPEPGPDDGSTVPFEPGLAPTRGSIRP